MKCIKEECQYYTQHMFYESSFRCQLSGGAYSKNGEVNCCIEKIIKKQEESLKDLKKYSDQIKNHLLERSDVCD